MNVWWKILLFATMVASSSVLADTDGNGRKLKGMKKRPSEEVEGKEKLTKKGSSAGTTESSAVPASSEKAYIYERMATTYVTNVDLIAAEDVEDVDEYYLSNIASMQTDDIVWDIDAGARKFQMEGTEAVGGLFSSFASRRLSSHQWSHYMTDDVVDEDGNDKTKVSVRYHGVILEAEGNYQDIFGVVIVHFTTDDLVDYVFVKRTYTLDRGYTAS